MSSPLALPQSWDLVSTAYVVDVMPMFETFARTALRLAAPPPGSRIVDVACGPGTLAALATDCQVDAIDFSPGMIEQLAARRLPHVTARVGDGQALPYASGTFAAGFSLFGLMFFPDRAKGFAELRRVLAPGARAVVSSWIPLSDIPVMAAMFGAITTALGGGPGSPPPVLSTPEACVAEMSAAFSAVEVHRVSYPQLAESPRALWDSIVRSMAPVALMKQNLPPLLWSKVDAAASAAIESHFGASRPELTMTALLTVGTAS